MGSTLALPENLFGEKETMRVLRVDSRFRCAVAMCKAHGAQPDTRLNHIMEGLGANYVLRGRGIYTDSEGDTYPLQPGTFFQRLPGKLHSTWIDPESDYAEFFLTLDTDTSVQLVQLGLIQPIPVMDLGLNGLILDEFLHLKARMALTESALPSSTLLVQIIQFLNGLYERGRQARHEGYWQSVVSKACLLLERNLDQRLDLPSISKELGIPYPTFRKRFREIMGSAPGEYRVRYRLEYACSLLLTHSVKQVAADLGYCDPFTFSAQFKHFVGLSPRQFQEKMQTVPEPGGLPRPSIITGE